MDHLRLPRGLKKYVRSEKARIRREVFDMAEQVKQIKELYGRILKNQKSDQNSQKAPAAQPILAQKATVAVESIK